MERGFVKLWRKTQDSRVFKNPNLLKVWVWCLMRANYKEDWVTIKTGRGENQVRVKPGEFVFGRKAASRELGMPESSVWKRMVKLKKLKNVNIKSDSQYSVVSIVNWDTYNPDQEKGDSKGDRQGTGKEQARNTEKKVKKDKNKIYSAEFLKFWDAYPKKTGKWAVWNAWQSKNGVRPPIDRLLSIIAIHKKGKSWKDGFIPLPATWLNQERWDDVVDVPKESIREEIVCKACGKSSGVIFASGYHPECEPDSFDKQVEGR